VKVGFFTCCVAIASSLLVASNLNGLGILNCTSKRVLAQLRGTREVLSSLGDYKFEATKFPGLGNRAICCFYKNALHCQHI